jgi:hypothetical protein
MSIATQISFDEITKNLAESFLQTVVVVDDEAYLRPSDVSRPLVAEGGPQTEQLVEPGPRGQPDIVVDNPPDDARPASTSHQLDAKVLIDSFALKGLVCAVLTPGKGEDLALNTLNAAQRADVVVLDWQLSNDDGVKAISIIKRLIEEDTKRGGRLRFVIVYTGEGNLETKCVTPVANALQFLNRSAKRADVLENELTRVVFIKKGSGAEEPVVGEIDEKQLPDRVVQEFAEMTRGILANTVMESMSSVRNETHRVLARFHNRLDGAYLTHRILSVTPDDAEPFLVDLIGDEFRALLETHKVGHDGCGIQSLEYFIRSLEHNGVTFQIKAGSEPASAELKIVPATEVIESLQKGIETAANLWQNKNSLYKKIYPLLSPADPSAGLKCHYDFCRLSALRREAYGFPHEATSWRPRLELGTVVVTDADEYFVCLQPVCDSVRLVPEQSHPFIFSGCERKDSKFDLVVLDKNGSNVCLRFNEQPFKTRLFNLKPTDGGEVRAKTVSANQHVFEATSNEGALNLTWIGDLRAPFAMRLAHRVATELSRIGLDEFEWLRKHAKG